MVTEMTKTTLNLRQCALGLLLLAFATASSSLTMGRVRGAVVLGQPLNLSVPVQVEPGQDGRAACLVADVFNGDVRMDPGRLTVSMEAADAAGNAVVRIRSTAVVDEPFVTLELTAGCGQVLSRRYVLLADVITDLAPEPAVLPAATVAAPAPTQPGAATTAAGTAGAPVVVAPLSPPAANTQRSVARTGQPSAPTRSAPLQRNESSGVVKAAPRKSSPEAQPRLKLDPVVPAPKAEAGLKKSTELSTLPNVASDKGAEAAAVWRAMNMQPQDLAKETQRVQGLELEIKTLRELTARNQAVLNEVNARLQKAEADAKLASYVYVLGGLLALAVVVAGFLALRLRNRAKMASAWWEDRDEVAKADMRLRMMAGKAGSAGALVKDPDVDLDMGRAGVSAADAGAAAAGGKASKPDPDATIKLDSRATTSDVAAFSTGSKSTHPEELFDVQQQADFFLSLGQTDQAIALLNNHIRSNEETGPTAYLDLLRIYHTTGRAQEYEALRSSFMRVFNANVPRMEAFGDQTRSLEDYGDLMASLQAVWGTPKAAKMIDEMIYRRPGGKWDQALELSAYRDLLTLHSVAKEIAATPSADRPAVSGFGGLPTSAKAGGDAAGRVPSSGSRSAAGGGLDVDLAGLEPSSSVGDISAYTSPRVDFAMEPTRPATLEELPVLGKMAPQAPPPTPAPEPELPGNLLEFDMVLPPPVPDKPPQG